MAKSPDSGSGMSDANIFKKVRKSEKKLVLRTLISQKIEMVAKGESDAIFYLSAEKMINDETLLVRMTEQSPLVTKSDLLIINFSINDDRYFFQSSWATGREVGSVAIDVEGEFFVLQRRKSPRLEIPTDFLGLMNISLYLSKAVFYETRVHDFGTGGCRLVYDQQTPLFKTGDLFSGFLRLGKKNPFELKCEVRHTFFDPLAPTSSQIFGVRFVELSTIDQNRLMVVFMDLQRSLFTKRTNDTI
jgi:c-di-GMP-binding flagellar brake protein YcgR